jgi:hypothetical protein
MARQNLLWGTATYSVIDEHTSFKVIASRSTREKAGFLGMGNFAFCCALVASYCGLSYFLAGSFLIG